MRTAAVTLAATCPQRAVAGPFEGPWDAEHRRTLEQWIARDEEW